MWFLGPILGALGTGAGAAGAAGAGGALSGIGGMMAGTQLPEMAGKVAGGIFGDAAAGAFGGMNNADMIGQMYQHQQSNPKDKGGAQAAQMEMQKAMQAGQSQAGQYQDMGNPQSLMKMMQSMFGGMM